MSQSFAESYLGRLRAKIGPELLLVAGMRCVIEDKAGRVLLVRRRELGAWGLPAGAAEPGESMLECVRREVLEETGLQVAGVEVFGFSSNPRSEIYVYANGDQIHGFSLLVRAVAWQGKLASVDLAADEALEARFFLPGEIPENHFAHEMKTLAALAEFRRTGLFQLD